MVMLLVLWAGGGVSTTSMRRRTAHRWRVAVPLLLCGAYFSGGHAAVEALANQHAAAAQRFDGVFVPGPAQLGVPSSASRFDERDAGATCLQVPTRDAEALRAAADCAADSPGLPAIGPYPAQ